MKLRADVAEALRSFDSLPDCAEVRLPVVQALKGGISPATVWRRVASGDLPQPHRINPRCTVWVVGDLRRHLNKAA